jgi:hypothetical protein
MNDNAKRVPALSLREQFSKGSEAWKEQSDPIFRFSTQGDWWGFSFFSLSASRYFGEKETLCLYWPLGTVVNWRPSKNWLKPSVSTGPELLVTSSVASLKAPSNPSTESFS